jgi:hypothetical protein
MSGGSLGDFSPLQVLDPVGSLGINATNSLLGTNILGQGGMSNNLGTKVGNSVAGWNLFNAGNLQNPGGSGSGPTLPNVLTPAGPTNPSFYSATAFAPRQAPGPGAYNAMAAQLAGPVYAGGVQIPGVSPALLNMPLGAQAPGKGLAASGPAQAPAASPTLQQVLGKLRAGGLNNGFMPTNPGGPYMGLSPRGSIQTF